jgi:serine protease Do
MKVFRVAAPLLFLFLFSSPLLSADSLKKDTPPASPTAVKLQPESLDDLKAIQAQTHKVLEKVLPCTVGVRIGDASGSGVIVSKDGYVLTAGHVSGAPGKKCKIILPDGKELAGKSLGRNDSIDSGMFKITDEGEWPFVEMGKSSDLKVGQWCIATGHPNGFQPGRSPPVRLGRIRLSDKNKVESDCTLVGGDSGGPLFDLDGKVIAIHSRIGTLTTTNVHVPVDVYTSSWNKLVKGVDIGSTKVSPGAASLGTYYDPDDDRKLNVVEGSPAEMAGLKSGDMILKFDGKDLSNFEDLVDAVREKKPGDEVELLVQRGDRQLTLKVTLGKR